MSAPAWDATDAWVLASIGHRPRPCTLVELVAAADGINHAILLETELESSLGKLTGAGLVRVFEGWTFELTDDGLVLASTPTSGLAEQLKELLAQLENFEPGRTRVTLPRGLLARAVEEYLAR